MKKRKNKKIKSITVSSSTEEWTGNTLPSIEVHIPEDPPNYKEEPYSAKLWAREAWFDGYMTVSQIAEAINTSNNTILKWIKGSRSERGWREEKETIAKRTIRSVSKRHAEKLIATMDKLLDLIEINTDRLLDNRIELGVHEYGQVITSFEKLYKLKQLSEGNPTEIIEGRIEDVSWTHIKERLEAVDILDFKKVGELVGK